MAWSNSEADGRLPMIGLDYLNVREARDTVQIDTGCGYISTGDRDRFDCLSHRLRTDNLDFHFARFTHSIGNGTRGSTRIGVRRHPQCVQLRLLIARTATSRSP